MFLSGAQNIFWDQWSRGPINEVLKTFSGCCSYGKDTCDYDEFIATVFSMCSVNLGV